MRDVCAQSWIVSPKLPAFIKKWLESKIDKLIRFSFKQDEFEPIPAVCVVLSHHIRWGRPLAHQSSAQSGMADQFQQDQP